MTRIPFVRLAALVAALVAAPPASAQAPSPPALTISGPAGNYTYTLTLPAGATITTTPGGITITWAPVPTPPAPPTPPTTGPYFVVFVTDRASAQAPLTPAQLALSTSTTIAASLKSISPQNQWASPVDVSSPTIAGWLPSIRAVGTPCILVIAMGATDVGFKVEAIPSPADEPSVVAEIRRLAAGGLPR